MHDTADGLEGGRRPAAGTHNSGAMREEDGPPAGHRGDPAHNPGAGPDLRGPAPTGRTKDDRTDCGEDGRRHRTARPLTRAARPARAVMRERPLGRGLIVTQTRTTRRYHFADSPHPRSPRPRAPGEPRHRLAGGDPAQRHPGPHRLPSREETRLSTGGPTPGPPRLNRGQQERGRRRAPGRDPPPALRRP
jgi:hypothetical protein